MGSHDAEKNSAKLMKSTKWQNEREKEWNEIQSGRSEWN